MQDRFWTFREYVHSNGRPAIRRWVGKLPRGVDVEVKAELDALIDLLVVQRGFSAKVWELRRGCEPIYELKIRVRKVQYRPLAYKGPAANEITLLAGAIEKDWELDIDCGTVIARMKECNLDRGRTIPYERG